MERVIWIRECLRKIEQSVAELSSMIVEVNPLVIMQVEERVDKQVRLISEILQELSGSLKQLYLACDPGKEQSSVLLEAAEELRKDSSHDRLVQRLLSQYHEEQMAKNRAAKVLKKLNLV